MAASTKEEVAATIVGVERGAVDRWGRGDPMGFVEIAAPQITYFDPDLEWRICGGRQEGDNR